MVRAVRVGSVGAMALMVVVSMVVVSVLVAVAPVRGAAAVVRAPVSEIEVSGGCDQGREVFVFTYRLKNKDGAPLALSAVVSGPGGGTVEMTPNPVPARQTSTGTIELPPYFEGEGVTTVDFVDPPSPNAGSHTTIRLGACPVHLSTSLDPAQIVTPPLPTTSVPVAADPPAVADHPTTTTVLPSTSSVAASATAGVADAGADRTATSAPGPADPGGREDAAPPPGSSGSGLGAWWWAVLLGLAVVGLVGALVARARRAAGPTG